MKSVIGGGKLNKSNFKRLLLIVKKIVMVGWNGSLLDKLKLIGKVFPIDFIINVWIGKSLNENWQIESILSISFSIILKLYNSISVPKYLLSYLVALIRIILLIHLNHIISSC